MTAKDVSYYRKLPYTRAVTLIDEASGGPLFLAYVAELPWIEIHGETKEEALLKLDQIFDDWIEDMIEAGEEILEPEPWPGPTRHGPKAMARSVIRRLRRDHVPSAATTKDPEPFTVPPRRSELVTSS